MKVHHLLIKLFILFSMFTTQTYANDSRHGSLKSGEKVIIKPRDNYAFSVTKTKGMAASNASYNVRLVNGEELIYEDKDLVDDIYLVFHDDILPGDRMHIEVNRGYFDYSLTPLLKLPKIVKDVIEPEVIEKAKHPKKYKKQEKRSPSVKTPPPSKVHPQQVAEPVTAQVAAQSASSSVVETAVEESQSVAVPALEGDMTYSSPIGETFFEKFTKIFKELVHSLSFHTKEKTTPAEKKEPISTPAKVENKQAALPNFDDSVLKDAAIVKRNHFQEPKRGIENSFDDSALKAEATLEKRDYHVANRGISENFDDSALQKSAMISSKHFDTPKAISVASKLPTSAEAKSDFSSPSQAPIANESAPITTEAEALPAFDDVPAQHTGIVDEAPRVASSQRAVVPSNPSRQTTQVRSESYPDTGYKEGYEDLERGSTEVQQKPLRERVIEDTSLPQNSVTKAEDGSDKLIITKRIQASHEEADPFAGRVLGRMDDRVLGTGYNGAASTAKLGVRVTKNSRPVSAWIEVFKDGTKKRVKTFYTSRSKKVKKVKLPAGDYTLRATYRTRDAKQQKTIRNIHLSEGDNINRTIAFHDGKLRVIARRGEEPLYVKIVVYKSGSRHRVTYDFSSRSSGISQFSLNSGTYDIEVIEHQNNQHYDNIHIQAGKTSTVHADF